MSPSVPSVLRWLPVVALMGCVNVYQPISGLQRPVAIDMGYANFEGLRVTLQCVPGEVLDRKDSRKLCRHLGALFTNQGAEVEQKVGRETGPLAALNIEISSRVVQQEITRFLWWRIRHDYIFAQRVVVRDETGFMLAQETLQGRFRRRFGFGSEAAEEFSGDLNGQMSQIAFDASMRRRVLRAGDAGIR